MGLEWGVQFEGSRVPGEIPQSHQPPVVAVRLGNRQLVACDMERRPLPSVRGLDLDEPISTVRFETLDVVARAVPVDIRHPSDATSKVGSAGGQQRRALMGKNALLTSATERPVTGV